MIVLGDRYKFVPTEIEKLKKRFKNTEFIKYNDQYPEKIIEFFEEKIVKNECELIILNTRDKINDELLKYLTNLELKGVNFITIEHFLEKYLHKCYISEDNSDISFLENIKPFSTFQYIQKRFIDFIISIPLAIIASPIMFYCAYRIKKESPDGPVFFKQTRVGAKGKKFTCYKFRSMRTDIDFFHLYTQENDPRIFPWGKIMRKMRIDELPQLYNVLKGEMHLIGPRAEWDKLVENYEKEIPYYNERHLVAPGITGWAQVNYPYGSNIEDTKQKLMYDLYYIKYWNIWLEIKTIFKTILVMVGKKGL